MVSSESVEGMLTGVASGVVPEAVDPAILMLLLGPWAGAFAFVFGLLWGSFANVVIWRVPRGQSVIRPRSQCPGCKRPIAWYDNIPLLSYLWLRGQCRGCGQAIGMRYLVVELLAGVLAFSLYMQMVVVPLAQGGGYGLIPWVLWFVFGLALLIVTYTDLDLWVIPNVVVLPVAATGLTAALIDPSWLGVPAAEAAIAASLGYGLIWGMRWIYRHLRGLEALGLGDAKLLLMVGAFCGLQGLVWTVAAGAIQGLVVAIPAVVFGKNLTRHSLAEVHGSDPELGEEKPGSVMGARVPFGPFLALAAIEFMLLRDAIEAWIVANLL
ncbi:MAG: prepilin peptidase, partial [Nannocystaceae bacterium]